MNNLFNHLQKEARTISLTAAEKQRMHARLMSAVSGTPVAVPSPYQRFFAPRALAYAFVAVLVVGSGTTYAAQGALPGNPLYSVKIHMNERMEAALAVTPKAKLEVSAKLAERRIREIETLAAQGTLNAEVTLAAEKNFDFHTAKIETAAKEDRSGKDDAKAFALKVDASLETLDALHEDDEENAADTLALSAAPTMTMKAAFVTEGTSTATTASDDAKKRPDSREKDGREKVKKEDRDSVRKNSEHFIEHVRAKVEKIRREHNDEDEDRSESNDDDDRSGKSSNDSSDDDRGSFDLRF